MTETHETIADIILEKRQEANYIVQFAQGKCHARRDKAEDEARNIRREADRIEAALKREHGDTAKLREAVRECAQYIACVGGVGVGEVTINDNVHLIPEELVQRAIAALAAPPRNCDRFASAEEAFHAWNNTVDTPGGGAYVGLIDWLYAPATEKKGGNDAD